MDPLRLLLPLPGPPLSRLLLLLPLMLRQSLFPFAQ